MEEHGKTAAEGKAQISKSEKNSQSDHRTRSLGTPGREGQSNGVAPIRLGGNACDGGQETRSVGGILRQLKRAKESYLEYVNAHSERLRLRLAEDEAQRRQLQEDISRLEREIAEIEEPENENN